MIRTILATTDLSQRGDRALRRGFALARVLGARMVVLSIVDDALPEAILKEVLEEARLSLTDFAEQLGEGVDYEVRVLSGDPTGDILTHMTEVGADLLVIGVPRERSLLGFLRETTAQRVTRLAEIPVLIAADRNEPPYDVVILGADFSPNATAGARLAAELAPGVPIEPVHALHVPYHGMLSQSGNGDDLLRSFSREPRQNDALWRDTQDLPAQLKPTEIVEGSAPQVLGQRAHHHVTPLIVVGAHGRVGQHRALLGSVADELMRHPPCDLLIVRRPGP